MKKIKTGISGLDELLGGGIPKGRNVLISGSCGSGKTTLSMQFIYEGIKQFNEPGVFVTLEEDMEKIYDDMGNFGWNLWELEQQGKLALLGGHFSTLLSHKKKYNAKVADLVGELSDVVKQIGAKRLAIDSLNLFTMMFTDPVEQREALAELCSSLSKLGCTTFLTHEARQEGRGLTSYGMEEYVVDGVIVLYNVMSRPTSTFTQGVAIRKMRGVDHDRGIKVYTITDKGIEVYPKEPMMSGGLGND